MSYLDVASILDGEILAIRARHRARLTAEHLRMARARQRVEDARIVAAREARIAAERAHVRVREMVEP